MGGKAADKKKEPEAVKSSGVSICTVFLVVGVTNAALWFGISSMNLQHNEDWSTYKASVDASIASSVEKLSSRLSDVAAQQSVDAVAKVSAHNTQSLASIQANIGGFKLTELSSRINSLKTDVESSISNLEASLSAESAEALAKYAAVLEEYKAEVSKRFSEIKVAKIDDTLESADQKQAEIFTLVDQLKKAQADLLTKVQGIGSSSTKMEATFGDKVASLENEMYRLQGDIVKIQEVATQAESFSIWHSSVGDELESTVDTLIRSDSANSATLANVDAQVKEIPTLREEYRTFAKSSLEKDGAIGNDVRKLDGALQQAEAAIKQQSVELENLKTQLLSAQDKIADLEASAAKSQEVAAPVVAEPVPVEQPVAAEPEPVSEDESAEAVAEETESAPEKVSEDVSVESSEEGEIEATPVGDDEISTGAKDEL